MLLCVVLAMDVRASEPEVRVSAPGHAPLALDAGALAAMPHVSVTAAAHDEPPSEWRGVPLREILLRAGAPLDKPLHGRDLASFVRITASDHYQVVFALAELDPTLGHAQAMLVDQRNGQPLAGDGPYRLLVPGEQRPARWVRNVTAIEVVDGSRSPP
ncbi:molybdopterin-dependent oxidoreductase [Dyella solisilvae]|nr:molybdopterin-dependent oxidoreductase [Dyella solisilvae]